MSSRNQQHEFTVLTALRVFGESFPTDDDDKILKDSQWQDLSAEWDTKEEKSLYCFK